MHYYYHVIIIIIIIIVVAAVLAAPIGRVHFYSGPCNLEGDHARLPALSQESLFYQRQTAFSARLLHCHFMSPPRK